MSIVILGKNKEILNKYSSKRKREVLGSESGSCNIIHGSGYGRPSKEGNETIELFKEVRSEPWRYPREEQ